MKDHEINITIAKACGKPVCRHQPEKWERRGPDGDSELYCTECKEYLSNMRVADYCADLNAMHEAEKTLTFVPSVMFRLQLSKNSDGPNKQFPTVEAAMCHATARQRATAFVRVFGKYVACALLCLTLTGCKTTDNGEQQMEYSRVIPGFGNTLP